MKIADISQAAFRAAAILCVGVTALAAVPSPAQARGHAHPHMHRGHAAILAKHSRFAGDTPEACAASVIAGEANPNSDADQAGVANVLKRRAEERGISICGAAMQGFVPKPGRVTLAMLRIASAVLGGDLSQVPEPIRAANEIRAPRRKVWRVSGEYLGQVGPGTNMYFALDIK